MKQMNVLQPQARNTMHLMHCWFRSCIIPHDFVLCKMVHWCFSGLQTVSVSKLFLEGTNELNYKLVGKIQFYN